MLTAEIRAALERLSSERRRVHVPFLLPDRNELDAARGNSWSTTRGYRQNEYNILKKKTQNDLAAVFQAARLPPVYGRVIVACRWLEADKRRDPDNIASGAKKILMDALGPGRAGARGWYGARVLHCDGWHCIAGYLDVFDVAPQGGVGVDVVIAPLQLEIPDALRPVVGRALAVDIR
jgi:hypothetical protein